MARTLTVASKTSLYSQSAGASLPILISISHTYVGASSPVYLCNNNVSLVYGGNTYLPFAFTFDPPDTTQDGIANARLVIDATDQSIIEILRSVTASPVITVRAMFYESSNGSVVFEELVPWQFTLKNVVYNINTISGDLIYEDRLQNQMGPIEFTTRTSPGVH
jgi:hypothetical protein